MTPKIARFLAQHQPATPCLVLDVDRVEDNFRTLQMRCRWRGSTMPSRPIRRRQVLRAAGRPVQLFRCGQYRGSDLVPGGRRTAGRVSFGNTIKKVSAIRRAHEAGVTHVRIRFAGGTGKARRATHRALGCIAGFWWKMTAPTGRCHANSAPRSSVRVN